jgi:two-component system, NtrC family, sensor kinase
MAFPRFFGPKRRRPSAPSIASRLPSKTRQRLIWTISIGVIGLVGSGAYLSYQTLRQAALKNLEQSALSEVEHGADEIDIWLATLKTRVEMFANTETARTTDWASLQPYLQAEQARIGEFDALGLAYPDGTRYSTVSEPINVRDRQWFQTAMSGQTLVDNPSISPTTGLPIVPISAPIYVDPQPGDQPRGVLFGSINVDRLQQVVKDRKSGQNSYAFLLNANGQAIVHPNPRFMSTLEQPGPKLTEATDAGLAQVTQQMIAHHRGVDRVQIDQAGFYVAYFPLEQADWSLALVIPQENIDGQLHLLDGIAIVMLALAGSLVMLLIDVKSAETTRSQQRQAETARQLLEHRVTERTKALNHTLEQLKQSQLQLVQSEKMSALGGLVAGVAHEINNPVGFLIGNIGPAQNYINDLFELLDLYKTQYPEDNAVIANAIAAIDLDYIRTDLPKLIGSMQLGADRISAISHSLRTFSRADHDALVEFDLHDGLDSTLLILQHRLKANERRPAIAVLKTYGDLPLAKGYAGQLNQVFMNILANAIDALEEASAGRDYAELKDHPSQIQITTEFELESAATPVVIVRLRDNGVGMTATVKARIFEHLFTLKGVGKGTGLGLAIVQQIITEKHGGSIEVNSALGEGTEFVIRLPQTATAIAAAQAHSEAPAIPL